jgi:uncharacterized protein (DUF1330 family)
MELEMAKGIWVATYRAVKDEAKLGEYAKLAAPAISAGGGKFLARGTAVKAYENGILQRTVVIEFPSVEAAIATHDGAGYQAALKALDGGADREIRIVEGID